MQIRDIALTMNGRSLKIKIRLRKIPVKAAAPIAKRRKMRNMTLTLIVRILGSVKRSAKGPEKRIFAIIKETTKARDSMSLLS
jgi:hypothetical protein